MQDIESLLQQTSDHAQNGDWSGVLHLSEIILAVDSENTAAKSFRNVARQMLQDSPNGVTSRRAPKGSVLTEQRLPSPTDGRTSKPAAAENASAPQKPPTADTPPLFSHAFVGRESEFTRLKNALEEAGSGRGHMVMITGEPGIGKTRIVEELADYAESIGMKPIWGRCLETEGAPPYWPWVQIFQRLTESKSDVELRTALGSQAGIIGEIVGTLKDKLPDLPRPVALNNADSSRFRFSDAFCTFLRKVSQDEPMLIILEDLHWADNPSLLLLEFIAHELRSASLLLIGTYRDAGLGRKHPLQRTMGELTRESHFDRIHLSGLSRENICILMQSFTSVFPPTDLVKSVYKRTEGNPLFVIEFLRLISDEGKCYSGEKGWQKDNAEKWLAHIPEGIKQAIGRRLDYLGEECNEILSVAAVVGREFQEGVLKKLVPQIPDSRLCASLEEAVRAAVLEENPHCPGQYRFTHELVRETLADAVPLKKRLPLHDQIGQTLEECYGSSAEEHAKELVYHFSKAEAGVGKEKLTRYCLAAGDTALSAGELEESLDYFQRVLEIKQGLPPDEETALAFLGQGKAYFSLDTWGQLPVSARRPSAAMSAFQYFMEHDDLPRAVEALRCELNSRTSNIVVMSEKLQQKIQADSLHAGWLMAKKAKAEYERHRDYRKIFSALDSALQIAKRHKSLQLEHYVLEAMVRLEWDQEHTGKTLDAALKLIEIAKRMGDIESEFAGRIFACISLRRMGNLEQAKKHSKAWLAAAERRAPDRIAFALVGSYHDAALEGDWRKARIISENIFRLSGGGGLCAPILACLEYETGNCEMGDRFFDRFLQGYVRSAKGREGRLKNIAVVVPMMVMAGGKPKGLKQAERSANAVLSSNARTKGEKDAIWGLSMIAIVRHDRKLAARCYPMVRELGHPPLYIIRSIKGLLALLIGKSKEARAHFEEDMAFFRKSRYLPSLAWACHDYALFLVRENQTGDREKARSLLKEGLGIARDIGMPPLASKITARLRILEHSLGQRTAFPDGLTRREVEVLQLLVKGFTNRDIGDLLHISSKTVDNHLRNIYAKTASANRAEAAAYALRHHLDEAAV